MKEFFVCKKLDLFFCQVSNRKHNKNNIIGTFLQLRPCNVVLYFVFLLIYLHFYNLFNLFLLFLLMFSIHTRTAAGNNQQ